MSLAEALRRAKAECLEIILLRSDCFANSFITELPATQAHDVLIFGNAGFISHLKSHYDGPVTVTIVVRPQSEGDSPIPVPSSEPTGSQASEPFLKELLMLSFDREFARLFREAAALLEESVRLRTEYEAHNEKLKTLLKVVQTYLPKP